MEDFACICSWLDSDKNKKLKEKNEILILVKRVDFYKSSFMLSKNVVTSLNVNLLALSKWAIV